MDTSPAQPSTASHATGDVVALICAWVDAPPGDLLTSAQALSLSLTPSQRGALVVVERLADYFPGFAPAMRALAREPP